MAPIINNVQLVTISAVLP